MRKEILLTLGLSVGALASCGGEPYKNPTTPYEKVTTAFKGVEKSFQNIQTKSGKKPRNLKNKINPSDLSGGLAEIEALYSSDDSLGDAIDELSYSEPPMIQFQCLKKAVEKIGSGYSFGTKYYDTITGNIYFDIETGKKLEEKPENKMDYAFTLAMDIALGENDKIEADVTFDITLNQGEETYHTSWFVTMALLYKMDSESPNYTMSMYVCNDERDLSYMDYGCVYEYDYVDVQDGKIAEWRKLGYEASTPIVMDSAHPRFEKYLEEADFGVDTSVSRWYKNANLRRFAHNSESKTNVLAGALCDKLGLNETSAESQEFRNKSGQQNGALSDIYREFSTILRKEVVYDLIEKGEHSSSEQEQVTGLGVVDNSNHQPIGNYTIQNDLTLRELFSPSIGSGLYLTHLDGDGKETGMLGDLSSFLFSLRVQRKDKSDVKYADNILDQKYSSFFTELDKEDALDPKEVDLYISEPSTGLSTQLVLHHGEGLKDEISNSFYGKFPKELTDLGFPSYEDERAMFTYIKNNNEHMLKVENSDDSKLYDYFQKLQKEGYQYSEEEYDGNGHLIHRRTCSKRNDNKVHVVTIEDADMAQKEYFFLHFRIEDYVEPENPWLNWPAEEILIASGNILATLPPSGGNGYFDYYPDDGLVVLHNLTEEEISSFIDSCMGLEHGAYDGEHLTIFKEGQVFYRYVLLVQGSDVYLYYGTHEEIGLATIFINEDPYMRLELLDDYSGYCRFSTFPAGSYQLSYLDQMSGDKHPLEVKGAGQNGYEKVRYDDSSKSLILDEQTALCLYLPLGETKSVSLIRLKDAEVKYPYVEYPY